MIKPKVSVVVPNYRHEHFLPKRLESILDQDYQDFELIILDDYSPDNSRRVIESYVSGPRIRAIFNNTNSGSAYRQWALGFREARGEYIWFAESDDYAERDLLSALVHQLDSDPSVGLAFCQSVVVDENGQVLRTAKDWLAQRSSTGYDLTRWNADFSMSGQQYCAQFMYPWNMIDNGSSVLFRRSALERAGGIVTDLILCGDWMTYVNVLSESNVAYVARPLNYFRNHSATVRKQSTVELYYRESQLVLSSMRKQFKSLANKRLDWRHLNPFVQGLLSPERQPPRYKVPLARQWRLLRQSRLLTPAAILVAIRILARENVAELAYRVGLLKLVRKLAGRPADQQH